MNVIISLIAVLALAAIAYFVGDKASAVFGIAIPYLAFVVFVGGTIARVVKWAKSPVPFRIPTTCGQQKTLPWFKSNPVDNPSTGFGVFVRMVLEVLFFRTLFRNTKTELHPTDENTLTYASNYWLWAGSLVFHWSFLIILIRHTRFFLEPVPEFIIMLQNLDGVLQVGVPILYLTGVLMVAGIGYLLVRRLYSAQLRYISLPADYFPVLLILAIGITGITLRYFSKTDIVGVKEVTMGLITFSPVSVEGLHPLFYAHLMLVATLFAYFPFSKLVHGAGVLMTPTRNLANNNRAVRHINPWNPEVEIHSYEAYEDEFREKMKAAGIPVDKE
jgi:[DsrC]-trisulfide reductase subunit M